MKTDITLVADKCTISGPRIDGGFRVSLDVGEYMAEKVAQLLLLPQQVPLEVTIGLYIPGGDAAKYAGIPDELLVEKQQPYGGQPTTNTTK